MRKILSLTLAFLTVITVLSSCNKRNEVKPATMTQNTITCWTTYGYDKIRGERKAPENGATTASIYLARNEAEGVQLCMRSSERMRGVTFSLKSGGDDTISYNIFVVYYVTGANANRKFSDPMRDYHEGDKLNVKADESLSLYVEFKTNDTPAGKYDYCFELNDSLGNVISEYNVTLNVWNFSYPETPNLATAVGLWDTRIANWYGLYNKDIFKTFYDYLLEHKLSSYDLPYDILDPRADEYMSDPRVTSFCVRWRGEIDIEKVDKIYEKLKTNPVWMAKAVLYASDEPHSQEGFDKIRNNFPIYKERWPELKILIPFNVNRQVSENEDQLDFLSQYIDVLCPKLDMFKSEDRFPRYYERLMALKEGGKGIWTYVANIPGAPYSNVQIDMTGLTNRVVFWQTYQYNADGFLYWCVNNWLSDTDVWKDGNGELNYWGDGMLLYPGSSNRYNYSFEQFAPFPSIRLKIVRDGVEDYDLLKMAEELFGREWLDEKLNAVSPTNFSISVDNDGFAAIRTEIGNAISNAISESEASN